MKFNRRVITSLIVINVLMLGGAITLRVHRLKHPPLESIKGESVLLAIQLKVGQGDSFLMVSPDQKVTLVDCGPAYETSTLAWDAGLRVILPTLKGLGLSKIDQVILTHHHDDHIGGVLSLVKRMPVLRVFNNGRLEISRTYYHLMKVLRKRRISCKPLKRGDSLNLGQYLRTDVLSPSTLVPQGDIQEDYNDASLVMKINFGNFDMLLTGDIETSGERELCEFYGQGLRCDFLKVPHHGSRTSSSVGFLKLTRPLVAGMSLGKGNSYGHPAPEIVERYRQGVGEKFFRTDENGGLLFVTNGSECFLATQKGKFEKIEI